MVEIKECKRSHEAIGRVLRYYRKKRSISQKRLANHLGISFQQLQKYEKGINRVSIVRMLQIAQMVDISPVILIIEIIMEVERALEK